MPDRGRLRGSSGIAPGAPSAGVKVRGPRLERRYARVQHRRLPAAHRGEAALDRRRYLSCANIGSRARRHE